MKELEYNSYQKLSKQQNSNSAHQSSGNFYQKKCGLTKSNRPGKKQNKNWFEQHQNDKKKKNSSPQVIFTTMVIGEEDTIYSFEHFTDHIEDVDMEDNSSNIAHTGWDKNTGMNITGPLSMPF